MSAMSEARLKPQAVKVLRMLEQAGRLGVTTGEWLEAGIGRAGARIEELRRAGYEIGKRPVDPARPQGPQRYFLLNSPTEEPPERPGRGEVPFRPPRPAPAPVDREELTPAQEGGRLFDLSEVAQPENPLTSREAA